MEEAGSSNEGLGLDAEGQAGWSLGFMVDHSCVWLTQRTRRSREVWGRPQQEQWKGSTGMMRGLVEGKEVEGTLGRGLWSDGSRLNSLHSQGLISSLNFRKMKTREVDEFALAAQPLWE